MGKMKENPRYNVISMRISNNEQKHLEKLIESMQMSVSDIMREAIELFAAHHELEKPESSATSKKCSCQTKSKTQSYRRRMP